MKPILSEQPARPRLRRRPHPSLAFSLALAASSTSAASSSSTSPAFVVRSSCIAGDNAAVRRISSTYSPHPASCRVRLSLSSVDSPSYETYGDGFLYEKTFAELYSGDVDNGSNDDDSNDATTTASPATPCLPPWLIARAASLGYTHPTLVQKRALDAALLEGRDVVVHAQTGSGKTLSYLLPVLAGIDGSRAAVQALVVVPTRELGLQVVRVARRLCAASGGDNGGIAMAEEDDDDLDGDSDDDSEDAADVSVNASVNLSSRSSGGKIMIMPILQGSANRRQRAWAWAEPPHIVVGTPSELNKMVTRGGVRINSVKTVVVDEVDACLLGNGGSLAEKKGDVGGESSLLLSSGALHELLSRSLSPTYQEADVFQTSVEGPDGRHLKVSVSSSDPLMLGGAATALRGDLSDSPSFREKHRQTIFASATIPQHNHFLKQCVANGWTVREPVRVNVSPGELCPPTLDHAYVVCAEKKKKAAGLRRLIRKGREATTTEEEEEGATKGAKDVAMTKVLIFCDPRRSLETLAELLAQDLNGIVWKEGYGPEQEDGHDAIVSVLQLNDSLGGRSAAMQGFCGLGGSTGMSKFSGNGGNFGDVGSTSSSSGNGGIDRSADGVNVDGEEPLRILLSTDLAARGLDVPDVSHVINFDLPDGSDTYVHRGGRAGRMGRRGRVVSIISADQEFVLQRLANKLNLDVRCLARQKDKLKEGRRRV